MFSRLPTLFVYRTLPIVGSLFLVTVYEQRVIITWKVIGARPFGFWREWWCRESHINPVDLSPVAVEGVDVGGLGRGRIPVSIRHVEALRVVRLALASRHGR